MLIGATTKEEICSITHDGLGGQSISTCNGLIGTGEDKWTCRVVILSLKTGLDGQRQKISWTWAPC